MYDVLTGSWNWLGYPRYCMATTRPDGTIELQGGSSRRGKPRGPPGYRSLTTALKAKGFYIYLTHFEPFQFFYFFYLFID